MWLGPGVLGGIGLGLGYISPVSTLIKWFPDRRGMATGMAIMGFGGGAMIGAPLADMLMKHYATPTSVGVWETLLTMAAVYFVFMTMGAFGYRIPVPGWKPAGWAPPAAKANSMITTRNVHVNEAPKTPQFWLIWWVLCLNVTAGIGIIGMASPMLQEVFAGQLIGINAVFNDLTAAQKVQIAAIAAGFTGLLSLFNIAGRFFWASLSDYIGRKTTYYTFFALGIVLYASAPWSGHLGHIALFVLAFGIILSMYGGGFATVPAYLADMFGTQMVGAIHGRLITAWSAAGIFGPVIVNYLREYQLDHGVARAQVYDVTAYVLCGLLAIGFICNWLVKPVADKHFMSEAELEAERKLAHEAALKLKDSAARPSTDRATPPAMVVAAWLLVGVPILWGVWITLEKAWVLFK
jgi:MFS family permease